MGMIGIANLGNTCSISTLLQCMYHSASFRLILSKSTFQSDLGVQLQKVMRQMELYNGDAVLEPNGIVDLIQKESNGLFPRGEQHDIGELYTWLIDHLHTSSSFRFEIHPNMQGAARKVWDMLSAYQDKKHSNILDLCQGVQVAMIECGACKDHSHTIEPFTNVHLNLQSGDKNMDVADMWMHNFKSEKLKDWNCDKCKHKGGNRSVRIWKLPSFLVICLKRFGPDMKKLSHKVRIPATLTFSEGFTMAHPKRAFSYQLISIGNHFGTCMGGHYTALVKQDGTWFHFDDASAQKVENIEEVLESNQEGYLLFYERV